MPAVANFPKIEKSNILDDERKFIVNKDLFSNTFLSSNPFKLGAHRTTSDPPPVIVFKNPSQMVQQNPLSSAASLAQ